MKELSGIQALKLEDFEARKPVQLEFFELREAGLEQRYSHLIELYDAIPKYFYGKPERIQGSFLHALDRTFMHRGISYRAIIAPAKIEEPDGIFRDHYPTAREEIVEDALRKFVVEGQNAYLKDDKGLELASVVFTLYELQQELKARGHDLNITQIKEAILVCARTNITLNDASGKSMFLSNIFPTVGLQTRQEWKDAESRTKCFVRFHPLVTKAINDKAFRQFNYEKTMSYRRVIARWLHKRMSYNFTQAAACIPYNILLSTILRDSGTKRYEKISHNIREIHLALDEMVAANVLASYQTDIIHDEENKRKIADAKFNLFVSKAFESEMILANKWHKRIETQSR